MRVEDIDGVAEEIASISIESGLGFLLARVAVDEIVDTALEPEAGFGEALRGRAYDLLLRSAAPAGELDAPNPALPQALALAPDPGLPSGEAWRVVATAIDEEVDAGLDAQLETLSFFKRFIVEERHRGEIVYRWFHPTLREGLREQIGGLQSARAIAAVGSLLELRERLTEHWEAPERAGSFLLESLPAMVVATGDLSLISAAMKGAPETVARVQLEAISGVGDDRRAAGDTKAARDHAQDALLATGDRKDIVKAIALIGQAEAVLLDHDMWREARDMSAGALRIADDLLAEEPGRLDLLEVAVRATRMLVASLGSGAFDAGQGVGYANHMLSRVAAAEPAAQVALAPAVAELLQSYTDSLNAVVSTRVQAEAAAAAAQIRSHLVEAGREDLRLPLSESLAYAWMARERLGDPAGLEDFRRSLDETLGEGAIPAEWILRVSPLVGELAQALGFGGRHDEALDLLSRAVQAYGPAVEAAAPSEGFPFGMVGALTQRSAVLIALGLTGEALEDAQRAMDLAVAHRESGLGLGSAQTTLALRLIDAGREADALETLDSPSEERPQAGPPSLFALASGGRWLREGEPRRAIEELAPALEGLDPGEPTRAPRNTAWLFNTFGLELRIGLTLAEAHEASGESEAAERAGYAAALAFLHREMAAPPQRLLHLPPWLREQALGWLEQAAPEAAGPKREPPEAWLRALSLLQSGRTDLDSVEEKAAVEVPLATSIDGAPPNFGSRAFERTLDPPPSDEESGWPASHVLAIQLKLAAGLEPDRSSSLVAYANRLLDA